MDKTLQIVIKFAHKFGLDFTQAQNFLDAVSLSDFAALTTALNNGDSKTATGIYNKYKNHINKFDAKDVVDFYNQQLQDNPDDVDGAVANTADYFGITGEEVEQAINDQKPVQEGSTPYIADKQVKAAYENVIEMLEGKPSKKLVMELNTWQRRMMLGLIPAVVSKVMQKTIDMTPIEIMQKHAKEHGYGEPAIKESELSLSEMLETIIEKELHKLKDVKPLEMPKDVDLEPLTGKDEIGNEAKPLDTPKVDAKTKKLIDAITSKKF